MSRLGLVLIYSYLTVAGEESRGEVLLDRPPRLRTL